MLLADAEGLVAWAASRSVAVSAAAAAGKDATGNDLPEPFYQSGVGVIPIVGPLMKSPSKIELAFGFASYTALAESLSTMAGTAGLKGIVIAMDSPGGDVAGIYEAADAIEAAARRIRIETVADGQCCSAALWLASKTAKISASKSSTIGSVGCIVTHTSVANALKARGVDVTVISDPSGKAAAHPFQALSEAGANVLQERVSEVAGQFREAVTAARPGLKSEALSGHVFSASRAHKLGLVDAVGETVNDVVRRLSAGVSPGAQLAAPNSAKFVARCRELAAAGKSRGESIAAAVAELPGPYQAWLDSRLNGERAPIFPN